MKLFDLNPYKQYKFRIGEAGENNVIWGAWQRGTFYICRRLADSRCKRNCRAGDIVTICPNDVLCAEFGQDDFQNGVFNNEDWYLEIEGLTN